MNLTKITVITLSSLSIATAASSSLANVDNDMQRCAVVALEQANIKSKQIVVDNSPAHLDEMDHNLSFSTTEYRMNLTSPQAGVDLGNISCQIDQTGKISSVEFLSKAS